MNARLASWAAWKADQQEPPEPGVMFLRRGPHPRLPEIVVTRGATVTNILFGEEGGPTHSLPGRMFWRLYYEAEEWQPETQAHFAKVFEIRAEYQCECCPARGKPTLHHERRSTKAHEISDLLAAWQFKGEDVDEDIILAEMAKCAVLCRKCHDKVHKAEKKLSSPRDYRTYIDSLRQFDWLDVDRIDELARICPE